MTAMTGMEEGAMYLRIARGRPDPARAGHHSGPGAGGDAAARRPAGCRGAGVGVDSESGALVAISWWDTREQAQRAAAGAASELAGVVFEAPEIYEVAPAAE